MRPDDLTTAIPSGRANVGMRVRIGCVCGPKRRIRWWGERGAGCACGGGGWRACCTTQGDLCRLLRAKVAVVGGQGRGDDGCERQSELSGSRASAWGRRCGGRQSLEGGQGMWGRGRYGRKIGRNGTARTSNLPALGVRVQASTSFHPAAVASIVDVGARTERGGVDRGKDRSLLHGQESIRMWPQPSTTALAKATRFGWCWIKAPVAADARSCSAEGSAGVRTSIVGGLRAGSAVQLSRGFRQM